MTTERLYAVADATAPETPPKLVQAPNRAAALRIAIADRYHVAPASAMQVAELVGAGAVVLKGQTGPDAT